TTMLNHAHLPRSWWRLAAEAWLWIRNRTTSSALPKAKTPLELWCKEKPDVSRFRVFGCYAHALVPPERRPAFTTHGRDCIFAGYS
ncbi:hypothetical protein EXIGLDRAFT_585190, partial [Exidia glandulosa HHB12029]